VGWARAAAFLYGDWGTSKAYVIVSPSWRCSFPPSRSFSRCARLRGWSVTITSSCAGISGWRRVYSSAREQSRVLAVLGALLLLADFIVTAALSGWDAMSYLGVRHEHVKIATLG